MIMEVRLDVEANLRNGALSHGLEQEKEGSGGD